MGIRKFIRSLIVCALLATATVSVQTDSTDALSAPAYQDAVDVCNPMAGPFSLVMLGTGSHQTIWGKITLADGETVDMTATHRKDHQWSGNWSGGLVLYSIEPDGTPGGSVFWNNFSLSYRWSTPTKRGESHSYTNTTGAEATYYVRVHRSSRVSIGGYENARTDYDFVIKDGNTVVRSCTARKAYGIGKATSFVADPVNTGSGELVMYANDIGFDGTFGMNWSRFYNSSDRQRFALGRGWVDSYATNVYTRNGGSVELINPDGTSYIFLPSTAGGFTDAAGFEGTLSGNTSSGYQIDYYNGTIADFDLSGKLETLTSWTGESVSIVRNSSGFPTSITSSTGQSFTISYTVGRVSQITTSDGRTVSYTHDANRFLSSFTNAEGGTTLYTTDGDNQVLTEHNPEGVLVMSNTYDTAGHVIAQTTGSGEVATFVYDIPANTTTVTFSPSGEVFTYVHDGQGRTVSVTDSAGGVETLTVDNHNNNPQVIDTTGETITSTYDDDGFLLTSTVPGAGTTTNTYDTNHRLLTVTEPTGAVTTYTYAGNERIPTTTTDALGGLTTNVIASGLVTSTTDPDGVTTTYTYNAQRQMVSSADGLGNTTDRTYDAAGRLLATTTPLGHTTGHTYDAVGRLLSTTDPTGAVTTYTYNANGQTLTETDGEGGVTTYTYNPAGQIDTMTNPRGYATSYVYDDYNQLLTTTKPGGAVSTNTYGDIGRVTSVTDPLGRATNNAYDGEGRQTSLTDTAGQTSYNTYGYGGRIDSETDSLGNVTTYNYDSFGRNTGITRADGTSTTSTLDLLNRPVSITNALGATTTRTYTAAGRNNTVTDPTGAATTIHYDAAGRATQTVDALGGTWISILDADGNVTSTATPEGLTTTYSYDASGRQTSQTDPNGLVATITYNHLSQPTQVAQTGVGAVSTTFDSIGALTSTNAMGDTASFAYDDRGNLTTVTDQAGQSFTTAFDLTDALTSVTDPLGRGTATTYDAAGRPETTTDATGLVATSSYDAASRLDTISFTGGDSRSYTHNAVGQKTAVTDSSGTQTYLYDAVGHITSITEADGDVIGYEYDQRGLQTAVIHPDGTRVESTYDALGRLSSVTHPTAGTVAYVWDGDSRPTSVTFPDGTTRTWLWTNDQVTTYQDRGRTWNLVYDTAGRLSGATGAEAWSLSYDASGRLVTASVDADTWSYSYDTVGNITGTTEPDGTTRSYSFDAANQLTAVSDASGSGTYTYNDAGRLTHQLNTDGTTRTYAYDGQGRLASTVSNTGAATARSYDPGGLLATVTHTDGPSTQTWDLTWDRTGVTPQLLSIDGPTGLTGFVRGTNLEIGVEAGGNTVYDRSLLGDVASGPLAVGADLSPYGSGSTGSIVGLGHRGELHIDGLVYLRNRDLDTSTQRFTTPDLLSPSWTSTSTSTYQYAANNPINFVDPMGLRPTESQTICKSGLPSVLGWAAEKSCDWQADGNVVTDVLFGVGDLGNGIGDTFLHSSLDVGGGLWDFAEDRQQFNRGLDVLFAGTSDIYESHGGGFTGALAVINKSGMNPAYNLEQTFEGLFAAIGAGDSRTASTQFGSAFMQAFAIRGTANRITQSRSPGNSNSSRRCSFSADTTVRMGDGSAKLISAIEIGDLVWSTDPVAEQDGPRRVTHVWVHQDQLVDLVVDGQSITTTEDHPFWNSTDSEWQDAEALDAGDLVLAADGEALAVEGIEWATETVAAAYNLTVDDLHTYYVGVGDSEVLVHNTLGEGCGSSRPLSTQKTGATQRLTNAEAKALAEYNGFRPTGQRVKREPVFRKGKLYIVQDTTSHIGGVWKIGRSVEALNSKLTRTATTDALLTPIGK